MKHCRFLEKTFHFYFQTITALMSAMKVVTSPDKEVLPEVNFVGEILARLDVSAAEK